MRKVGVGTSRRVRGRAIPIGRPRRGKCGRSEKLDVRPREGGRGVLPRAVVGGGAGGFYPQTAARPSQSTAAPNGSAVTPIAIAWRPDRRTPAEATPRPPSKTAGHRGEGEVGGRRTEGRSSSVHASTRSRCEGASAMAAQRAVRTPSPLAGPRRHRRLAERPMRTARRCRTMKTSVGRRCTRHVATARDGRRGKLDSSSARRADGRLLVIPQTGEARRTGQVLVASSAGCDHVSCVGAVLGNERGDGVPATFAGVLDEVLRAGRGRRSRRPADAGHPSRSGRGDPSQEKKKVRRARMAVETWPARCNISRTGGGGGGGVGVTEMPRHVRAGGEDEGELVGGPRVSRMHGTLWSA